jgi:hypothetical protein
MLLSVLIGKGCICQIMWKSGKGNEKYKLIAIIRIAGKLGRITLGAER